MDMDDEWDLNSLLPTKSQKQMLLERLLNKSPDRMSPLEVFKLINASISLDKFVPLALSLMEKGRFIDLNPEFPDEHHWTLLERQTSYFKNNPDQEKRLAHLKKVSDYRGAKAGKNSQSCYKCLDGRGEFKRLYETRSEAISSAEHRSRESGVRLTAYTCTHADGWHLKKI